MVLKWDRILRNNQGTGRQRCDEISRLKDLTQGFPNTRWTKYANGIFSWTTHHTWIHRLICPLNSKWRMVRVPIVSIHYIGYIFEEENPCYKLKRSLSKNLSIRSFRCHLLRKSGLISRTVNRAVDMFISDSISTAHLYFITLVETILRLLPTRRDNEYHVATWGLIILTRLSLWWNENLNL